jgi:sec-independent protein translocase protein TatA
MGSMSIWHWVIVALVFMLLFGKGRISEMMGDLAKGIKSFKKGLADEETTSVPQAPPAQVTQIPAAQPAPSPEQAPR